MMVPPVMASPGGAGEVVNTTANAASPSNHHNAMNGTSPPTSTLMGIPTELQVNISRGGGGTNGVHHGGGIYGGAGAGGGPPPPFTQEDVRSGPQSFHHHHSHQQQPTLQQQQQQQFHHQQFAMNTPWKLGSTDGTYAMNVAIRKQQQDMAGRLDGGGGNANNNPKDLSNGGGGGARLSPLLEDNVATAPSQIMTPNMNNSNKNKASSVAAGSSPGSSSGAGGVKIGGGPGGASSGLGGETDRTPLGFTNPEAAALIYAVQSQQSVYQDLLFRQPSGAVEAVLAAACEAMAFDIAEMWLRTGPKTHQLTNSHLRPTALEDSVRRDLVDVYYGEKSSERTHRLSPALCKRAKEASDVVWVTGHTPHGADALRASISNVRTAVAVPVCHEASNTNITIIFFSIRRYVRFLGSLGQTCISVVDLYFCCPAYTRFSLTILADILVNN